MNTQFKSVAMKMSPVSVYPEDETVTATATDSHFPKYLIALVLLALLLLGGSDRSHAQPPSAVSGDQQSIANGDNRQRIQRLQDTSTATMDWQPSLPALRQLPEQSRVLPTSAFTRLKVELDDVNTLIAATGATATMSAEDRAAMLPAELSLRCEQLQTEIRVRAEANIRAGFFYAAEVYIELFDQANGDQTISSELRQLLSQQRQLQLHESRMVGAIG